MDPDIVRQQEEAEREAQALALQKRAQAAEPGLPFAAQPAEAERFASVGAPVFLQTLAPSEETAVEKPVPTKKMPHPKRRALPPMGARGSRAPAPERIRHGILHGVARFLAYAIAGAMLGAILGNAAAGYLGVSPERSATVIFSAIGCFTFICSLISILHHEH